MKRILPFLLAIVMLFVFSGCTTQSAGVSFGRVKPWQASEFPGCGETVTYDVKRFYSPDTADEKLIGEGTMEFSLTVRSGDETALDMFYLLEYTADANESYHGKEDTISSSIVFNTSSLRPIKSEKTVVLANIAGKDNLSYATETDFGTLKSKIDYFNTPADGERDIKSGEYFDNEQLLYVVRALSSLTAGKETTFSLFNAYEMFLGKKFSLVPMKATVSSSLKNISVERSIYTKAEPREGDNPGKSETSGEYFIECLETVLTIDADKSGPSIMLYYSNLPLVSDLNASYKTSKVLTKIVYHEYSGSFLAYSEVYDIVSHRLT